MQKGSYTATRCTHTNASYSTVKNQRGHIILPSSVWCPRRQPSNSLDLGVTCDVLVLFSPMLSRPRSFSHAAALLQAASCKQSRLLNRPLIMHPALPSEQRSVPSSSLPYLRRRGLRSPSRRALRTRVGNAGDFIRVVRTTAQLLLRRITNRLEVRVLHSLLRC